MKTKKCEECGIEFTAKRDDAKFCSSTCRSNYWKKGLTKTQNKEYFRNTLKGVVDDSGKTTQTITETVPNKPYFEHKTQLKLLNQKAEQVKNQISKLKSELLQISNPAKVNMPLIAAGTGAILGYSMNGKDKNDSKRLNRTFWGAGIGLLGGALFHKSSNELIERNRQDRIAFLNVTINELNNKLSHLNTECFDVLALIANTPEYIQVEKQIPISIPKPALASANCLTHDSNIPTEINVPKHITQPNRPVINVNPTGKIISSSELTSMQYSALNFNGKWLNLIGFPSVNFHCAIHGMAGEGKSTFAIQFAHYLAENFGTVLYVSGEEGFAKTMKDKLVNNNASNENLMMADIRTYEELLAEVEPNIFNFMIIDSLDNMRIGASELKEIRNRYINSALVTISQSTKDGKMRGSYEIVHDSDIAISVSKGLAETVKNRFLEKGRYYEIFAQEGKNNTLLPRNVVLG